MALKYCESFYETTLATSINATQATIQVTTAPTVTSGYLVIEPKSSNREIISYSGVTGTTLTGCVRGLASIGTDDSAGTGKSHPAGASIAMKDVHFYLNKVVEVFNGTSATGTNTFKFGDGNTISAADRLLQINTSSLSAYFGLNSSGQFVVSENGADEYVISAGGSGVTGGDGIVITAGAIDVDRLSNSGLRISATKLAVNAGQGLSATSAGELYVDLTHDYTWTGLHNFSDVAIDGVQISAKAAEITQVCSGVSAYSSVTAYNLGDLTDGGATTLHKHGVSFRNITLSSNEYAYNVSTPFAVNALNVQAYDSTGNAYSWGTATSGANGCAYGGGSTKGTTDTYSINVDSVAGSDCTGKFNNFGTSSVMLSASTAGASVYLHITYFG